MGGRCSWMPVKFLLTLNFSTTWAHTSTYPHLFLANTSVIVFRDQWNWAPPWPQGKSPLVWLDNLNAISLANGQFKDVCGTNLANDGCPGRFPSLLNRGTRRGCSFFSASGYYLLTLELRQQPWKHAWSQSKKRRSQCPEVEQQNENIKEPGSISYQSWKHSKKGIRQIFALTV